MYFRIYIPLFTCLKGIRQKFIRLYILPGIKYISLLIGIIFNAEIIPVSDSSAFFVTSAHIPGLFHFQHLVVEVSELLPSAKPAHYGFVMQEGVFLVQKRQVGAPAIVDKRICQSLEDGQTVTTLDLTGF
ncbi:MAG: hypothetical protein R6U04_05110 [Bacteroidales bacterium]